jgi:hypothetical protein
MLQLSSWCGLTKNSNFLKRSRDAVVAPLLALLIVLAIPTNATPNKMLQFTCTKTYYKMTINSYPGKDLKIETSLCKK